VSGKLADTKSYFEQKVNKYRLYSPADEAQRYATLPMVILSILFD